MFNYKKIILLILVFFTSTCISVYLSHRIQMGRDDKSSLKVESTFNIVDEDGNISIDFEKAREVNKNITAWVISDDGISYPLMYTGDDTYKNSNIYGDTDKDGIPYIVSLPRAYSLVVNTKSDIDTATLGSQILKYEDKEERKDSTFYFIFESKKYKGTVKEFLTGSELEEKEKELSTVNPNSKEYRGLSNKSEYIISTYDKGFLDKNSEVNGDKKDKVRYGIYIVAEEYDEDIKLD